MFVDGKLDCTKKINYLKGKVSKIIKYRNNKVVEKLEYAYGNKGKRVIKRAYGNDITPYLEIQYDSDGRRIKETFTDKENNETKKRGYSIREIKYLSPDRTLEIHKDKNGKILSKKSLSE